MLSFLKGLLVSKVEQSPQGAYFLIEVSGIGFEVLTHGRAIIETPQNTGEWIQLYTAMIVRETAISLVGFLTKEERDLFNILQSASGVGTKVALALLSSLSVSDIIHYVISSHYKGLTIAKGVGPKLAQKITLELKDKMTNWRSTDHLKTQHQETSQACTTEPEQQAACQEAESVLLSLGYEPHEIRTSMKIYLESADSETICSEEILKSSLRYFATTV